ncbi:hypothetical protein LPJ68_003958, partial [Coemansia sp. RSA 1086]
QGLKERDEELLAQSMEFRVAVEQELSHSDLASNYQTFCDPRLNYEQSLDIAFKIAKVYADERNAVDFS